MSRVMREDVSAEHRRDENEMSHLHAHIRGVGSPMAELVAHEALGAPLGGRQLCASIVEMSVPKLLGIKLSLVEKWGRVFGILGPNDVKNELCHLFQEMKQGQGELRQATRFAIRQR